VLERIRQNKFLVVGRAGLDLYADPPGTRVEDAESFTTALGGSAGNIAVGIVKLGGAASLVSAVSDDAVGRFTVNQLRRYGVELDYVQSINGEARNSLAVVESRSENCQSVIYRNGAADFQMAENDVREIPFASFGALIVTGTSLACEPSRAAAFLAMTLARKSAVPVILDVDYRPYSWTSESNATATCSRAASMCDIVIGNDVEFAVLAGGGNGQSLAQQLAARSAAVVVYKMGEKGSVTYSDGKSFTTGIFPVKALKPTGAGDAFMGGFVTGLAMGIEIPLCIRRGSAAAAIVVTRVGCAPAMPTSAELDSFMAHQPDLTQ
jgi:5-dehydro-2-deoxygluconokinase